MLVRVNAADVFAATGGRPFDPALPAVVFIHGAGLDHTVWSLPARYFAHHGRTVLAVDLPGHGRSGGGLLTSIEAMAAWVIRLLDAANLPSAALVGHSMGSLVALTAAALAPRRIRALALVGTAERMPVHPELQAAAEANLVLAPELLVSWGHGDAGHFGGNPAPGLWRLGGSLRLLARAGPGVLGGDLAACNAYERATESAGKIECPTLLILGAADRMTPPAAAQSIVDAIRGCRKVVLPEAGHMLMAERPDAVIDALAAVV